jgi:hypothetical protein
MIEYLEYNIDTKQYFWIKKYIGNIEKIEIKE